MRGPSYYPSQTHVRYNASGNGTEVPCCSAIQQLEFSTRTSNYRTTSKCPCTTCWEGSVFIPTPDIFFRLFRHVERETERRSWSDGFGSGVGWNGPMRLRAPFCLLCQLRYPALRRMRGLLNIFCVYCALVVSYRCSWCCFRQGVGRIWDFAVVDCTGWM